MEPQNRFQDKSMDCIKQLSLSWGQKSKPSSGCRTSQTGSHTKTHCTLVMDTPTSLGNGPFCNPNLFLTAYRVLSGNKLMETEEGQEAPEVMPLLLHFQGPLLIRGNNPS